MNFRSLFWKIFLSFWVFMVLFGMSSVFISTQLRPTANQRQNIPVGKIIMHTRRLFMQDTSQAELTAWLERIQQRLHFDAVYILDAKGVDLLNRNLNSGIQHELQNNTETTFDFPPHFRGPSSFRGPPPIFSTEMEPPGPPVIIKKMSLSSGEEYTVIIDRQDIREDWRHWRSLSIGARIAIASILSGIICFFLARYLTRPLQKLRTATHRIASGHYKDPIDPDIAERKDEIGDLGRDFDSMATRIEISIQSQQRLLRDVSHELRSPLARLQIALGLAHQRSNGLIEPELQRIELEVERLNELISQSLSLARLSGQTSILEKTQIDLCELLSCVISNVEYEAQNKQCHILTTEMQGFFVEGNWDLLHSALENILRNAIRYTKAGTAIETAISLAIPPSGCIANLTIRDHGTGVPEADIDNLFKPFFRVDEARTQHSGGHGIGLAIAERAIHLHNGTISVVNASGGGLKVSLHIPASSEVE